MQDRSPTGQAGVLNHLSVPRTPDPSRRQRVISPSEPALPMLVRAHRTQEIYLAEGGPWHIAEIELAVCALPQQETGESHFAAGADDEVGVRRTGGVSMASDAIAGDLRDRLSQ